MFKDALDRALAHEAQIEELQEALQEMLEVEPLVEVEAGEEVVSLEA